MRINAGTHLARDVSEAEGQDQHVLGGGRYEEARQGLA